MADNLTVKHEFECQKCKRVKTTFTHVEIESMLNEKEIVYRGEVPTTSNTIELRWTCPTCGQKNVVELKRKSTK